MAATCICESHTLQVRGKKKFFFLFPIFIRDLKGEIRLSLSISLGIRVMCAWYPGEPVSDLQLTDLQY